MFLAFLPQKCEKLKYGTLMRYSDLLETDKMNPAGKGWDYRDVPKLMSYCGQFEMILSIKIVNFGRVERNALWIE